MTKRKFENWGFNIDRALVIAGPCSVESEEQVLQTALGLKNYDVDILRGGIWKPRTRPNSFEGHGKKALPWLKKAGEAIQKPTAVEVATAQHVEDALEAGIDYFWIGARTTVNPFAVQELAEALRGVTIPVFVKNPVNPDLKLWLGAVERFEAVGIEQIGVIHRGFSMFGESIYRNAPLWTIPIDFRQERPDLPLICDPSHIAGNRSLLLDVAQQALDLGFDGLMIESHINPSDALSDAKQQVTPEAFFKMTKAFKQRKQSTNDKLIDELRDTLSELDNIILDMVSERMTIAREIGMIKKEKNVAIYQPEQLKRAVQELLEDSEEIDLSKDFVLNYITAVHNESIRQQREIFHGKKFQDYSD